MGAVAAAVTPELSANALWIHNLSDGTAFFVPAASLLAADNIDLSIAAQIPVATEGSGEFKPARRDLQLDVPTATGGVSRLDLSGIVPSTTLILWTRFNF